jgi:FkbM family methyltransferase
MITSLMQAVIARPRFRGKTRVLRFLHRFSGTRPVRSKYGPLIYNRPRDATNFYYVCGTDEGNYGDVYEQVRSLMPGSCFIDVGANAGLFSVVAGPIVGNSGVVIAFEPNLAVFSDLVRNAAINRLCNLLPVNAAIGPGTDIVRFASGSNGHTGIGHLDPSGDTPVRQYRFEDLASVLDPFIGAREVVVKVDVEGAEEMVVDSMSAFLSRPQVSKLIVEIDEKHLARFGGSAKSLYRKLADIGFIGTRGMMIVEHYNEVFVRDRGRLS